MSKLLEKIKKDRLTVMKQGDRIVATQLTTLLGEASPSGNQEVTDQDVEKVVQKFAKNAKEMLKYTSDPQKQYNIEWEIVLYESYLPKQLTEDEIRRIITHAQEDLGLNNIGQIMGFLNKNHKGQFDGKLASQIAKEII